MIFTPSQRSLMMAARELARASAPNSQTTLATFAKLHAEIGDAIKMMEAEAISSTPVFDMDTKRNINPVWGPCSIWRGRAV